MANRRRARNSGAQFQLCSAGGPLGPEVVCRLSWGKGERMVRERKARHVRDEDGAVIGYQLTGEPKPKEPIMRESGPSSAVFSRAEVDAVVGFYGESRTARMPEMQILSRLKRSLPEMDLVEAAQVKLDVYQSVH